MSNKFDIDNKTLKNAPVPTKTDPFDDLIQSTDTEKVRKRLSRIRNFSEKNITPQLRNAIHMLMSAGATEQALARGLFGVAYATYIKIKSEYPVISQWVEEGLAMVEQRLASKLLQIALCDTHKSQVTSIIFLLKTKHKWRDRDPNLIVAPPQHTTGIDPELDDD